MMRIALSVRIPWKLDRKREQFSHARIASIASVLIVGSKKMFGVQPVATMFVNQTTERNELIFI
jgi:hypothetical protein